MLPAYAGMIPPPHLGGGAVGDVLPAYAGMIPSAGVRRGVILRAPRVCGDDPNAGNLNEVRIECSPRMRG